MNSRPDPRNHGFQILNMVKELVDDYYVHGFPLEATVHVSDRKPHTPIDASRPRGFFSRTHQRLIQIDALEIHIYALLREGSDELDLERASSRTKAHDLHTAIDASGLLYQLREVEMLGRFESMSLQKGAHIPFRPIMEYRRKRLALIVRRHPERDDLGSASQLPRPQARKHAIEARKQALCDKPVPVKNAAEQTTGVHCSTSIPLATWLEAANFHQSLHTEDQSMRYRPGMRSDWNGAPTPTEPSGKNS